MGRRMASQPEENRKNLVSVFLAILLFLAGAGVFFYPTVSNWLAVLHQSGVIQEYTEAVAEEGKIDYTAEWRKAREYNDSLAGDPVQDPFIPDTGRARQTNYRECLDVDGVMGYIEIPKIRVRLPIYHGTGEEVLQEGVGHIETTALPVGGDFTHAVLTGHRGLPGAKLFTDLDRMEIGDRFYLHVLDEVLAYEVDEINTVLPDELQTLEALRAVEGRDLVTLLTCTPYGVNTHRLLVRGTRVPYTPEEAEEHRLTAGIVSGLEMNAWLQYLGAAVGGMILVIGVAAAVVLRRRKKKSGRVKHAGKRRRGRKRYAGKGRRRMRHAGKKRRRVSSLFHA